MKSWGIPVFKELGRRRGTINYVEGEGKKTGVFDVIDADE